MRFICERNRLGAEELESGFHSFTKGRCACSSIPGLLHGDMKLDQKCACVCLLMAVGVRGRMNDLGRTLGLYKMSTAVYRCMQKSVPSISLQPSEFAQIEHSHAASQLWPAPAGPPVSLLVTFYHLHFVTSQIFSFASSYLKGWRSGSWGRWWEGW